MVKQKSLSNLIYNGEIVAGSLLILESRKDVSIQALLSAAIKHSRLLGDFMESVVKETNYYRAFQLVV